MSIVADQRTPGWFWLHDRIIDTYGRELGPIGIAVYACLARHADKAGESFPAKNTIATEIGASKRAVDTAIARLAHFKLITITKRKANPGDFDSNIYTLLNPPRFIVKPPVKTLDDLAAEAAEAENQPAPRSAPSSSPSLDRPLSVFPSGASGALPVVQVVHYPPAGDAPGSAGGALPPGQNDGSQLPMPPEFPSLTASNGSTTTSENPWEKTKAFMRLQLPKSTYDSWLRDTVLLAATEDEYTIRVHDANTREWLSKRLQNKIALNLQSIAGRQITVKYVTAQEIPQ
jgi:hypothetical protein